MKISKLSFLALAASLGTGCIINSTNNNPTTGTVTATWNLQDWSDANKAPIAASCPVGADTAIVYTLPAGDPNPQDANKDLFNCTDGGGTTAVLNPGSYTTWVEITDHSGAVLYAQSNSTTVTVVAGGNTNAPAFTFQVNRGYESVAWTLRGAVSGNTLTCTQAAAGGVETDNMVGNGTPISDQFDCGPMTGTTYPLPIDNYTVTVQAVDSNNPPQGIGPGSVLPGTANVQFGNQLVDMGSVVLQIDGL